MQRLRHDDSPAGDLSAHPVVRHLAEGGRGRVLLVNTAFLGDVVFLSPLVRALRTRFPNATLIVCTTPKGGEIAQCIPGVDETVVFDKRGRHRGLRFLNAARDIGPVDLAIAAHRSVRTVLFVRALRPRLTVGFDSLLARWLLDHVVSADASLTFPERYLRLGRLLGAGGDIALTLRAPLAALATAERLLAGRRTVAMIIGSEWATKRWLPERYAHVADALAAHGFASVLMGSAAERPIADAVLAATTQRESIVDAMGFSIADTLGLLARSVGALGGDTGLLHAARALSVPTVALFGPTSPAVHGFEPSTHVLTARVPCQPCHRHGPRRCPLGHHDCMQKLFPGEVVQEVLALARAPYAADVIFKKEQA